VSSAREAGLSLALLFSSQWERNIERKDPYALKMSASPRGRDATIDSSIARLPVGYSGLPTPVKTAQDYFSSQGSVDKDSFIERYSSGT
jgi:hypothetical protein